MKGFCITLSLFLLFSLEYNATYAQKKVWDIKHKKKIRDNVKRDVRQIIQFEALEELSREVLDGVEATWELQFAIQEALRKVESVKDLQWSDIGFFLENMVSFSNDPQDYIVNIPYTDQLKQLYALNENPLTVGKEIYGLLVSLDTETPSPEALPGLRQKHFEEGISQFAFAEFAAKRKVQLALIYQQFSSEKLLKAAEMNGLVTTAEWFSMKEADRVRILKYVDEYVRESYQLKLKADRLINEVQKPYEAKKAAMKNYRDKLYRESLAEFFMILVITFSFSTGIAQDLMLVEDKKARKETQADMIRNFIKDFWQKELAGIAEGTRGHYEQIEMLQTEIQEALKLAETIKDLQWSDLASSLDNAYDISFDFNAYVNPGIGYAQQFKTIYDNRENLPANAQVIYQLIVGFDLLHGGASDYEEILGQQKVAAAFTFAFLEIADKKKMHTAKAYQVIAEELQEKAAELNQAVLQEDKFSMTEAERITLLKFNEDYLVKSFELLEKSDALIESILNSPYSIRNQAIQIYSNNIYRGSVKVEGQYRFGE